MNRINAYDPLAEFFPQVLRGFVQPAREKSAVTSAIASVMRMDVTESENAYVVRAEIPGVSKEDINVEIDGANVAISALVKPRGEQVEGVRLVRNERYEGKLSRSLSFSAEIEEESAVASYENGVLELSLPKKTVVGAKRLAIS
ncbi:MAG: Hsp20/alpha crystallin family protein [Burkholderiaceae bacterium]